jgi:hypothetical protein
MIFNMNIKHLYNIIKFTILKFYIKKLQKKIIIKSNLIIFK